VAASNKALWFDELFTFHVAKLSGFSAIWSALAQGVDNHAPLDYWIRHWFMKSFGTSEVVFRLPSIIAFGVAFYCLVRFVARRSSPVYGLFAGVILLSTQSHRYAYEGRPYALMLAFGALSLLCWQLATEGKRGAQVGLALALAGGLYSYYYAVLLFVPLVLGELWRTFERKHVDWGIWMAFTIGGVPLLTMLPLIGAARQFAGGFWTGVDAGAVLDIYSNFMGASELILLLLLSWLLLMPRMHPATAVRRGDVPSHEIAAAAGYLLLPIVCYVIAKTITGALLDRYVLPMVIGVAVLPPMAVYRIRKDSGLAIPVAVACLALLGATTWVDTYREVPKKAGVAVRVEEMNQWLPDSGEPVVIANWILFAQLTHYAPPGVQQRLIYAASLQDSLNLNGADTPDRGLLGLRPLLPSRVMQYQEFVGRTPRFRMILAKDSWQLKKLIHDRANITAVGIFRGEPVYDVSFSKSDGPNSSAPTTSQSSQTPRQ
jgi:hypothetical protein